MTVLADDEPVVRMGAERLVLGAEPRGDLLGDGLGSGPVDARADDEPRDIGEWPRVHVDAGDDGPARPAALVRLLAEEMLDPEHVADRQISVITLELLRQGRPPDLPAAVDVGDLA